MNNTPITAREKQVLEQISYGYSTKEIANQLFVSDHTIFSHRKNLLEKLNARNTASLIRKAFEIGTLTLHQQR